MHTFAPIFAQLRPDSAIWFAVLLMAGCGVNSPQPVTIIHVANWHWVPKPYFVADLKDLEPTLTDAEIDERYAQHLNDVEELQRQQVELLRDLCKTHGLKNIFYEGVTEENLEACHKSNARAKRLDTLQSEIDALGNDREADAIREKLESLRAELREESLQLGAIGHLIRSGEIADYLPLEDAGRLADADPLGPDGKLRSSPTAEKAREDEMAKRLLTAGPVAIVVLGGDHDLEDNLKKLLPSVRHQKIQTAKYRELATR